MPHYREEKIRVGILGATGAVGQKFIDLLRDHPWFEISSLVASERSAGKKYSDASNWLSGNALPAHVGEMMVSSPDEDSPCDLVFSGLDAKVATEIEESFASRGIPVVSNARNFRMDSVTPLIIPEVNPDHISLISEQSWSENGFIVTNPNCSTVGVVSALKPLHDRFGIAAVHITTMQALSGAGYPGVSSLDTLGNVIPFIGGEEAKLESEPLKLLGSLEGDHIRAAAFPISAQCNRVPVVDGHLVSVSVTLDGDPSLADIARAFDEFRPEIDEYNLPTAPRPFLTVFEDQRYPQPMRHVMLGGGMTVSIGRLRKCPVLGARFVTLVHNTIRGAAGGAILNAELLVKKGYITGRQ